jgi:cytochrome c oxidase cbb3-type subunit III
MAKIEHDDITGTATTGHEWDGIKELNTPLPRWWLWTFYATIAWALAYSIAYPAWPLIHSATSGLLGYSSRNEVAQDMAKASQAQGQWLDKIKAANLDDIVKDQELLQFARAGGAAAFKVNCVQCHGSGAAGGHGYPNLNDDDWLWGGTLDQIHTTLENGVRVAGNDQTRLSEMPAFGAGILDPQQISDAAEFVLKISGQPHDEAAATKGATVFADNCASCHGANGEGNREFGAPRLTDAIWLYGSDKATIIAQITKPRQGVMPAWGHRLDETTIKELAVFVHSLGGGEKTVAAQ